MSLTPLLMADTTIQIHAGAAIAAFLIGAMVLWRRKGTALHKALGRIWVVLMLVVATSALFIHEIGLIGPFSPIHLFVLVTYVGIARGLWAIIVERDIGKHRATMQAVYVGALLLAEGCTTCCSALILISAALVGNGLLWRRLMPWRRVP